MKIHRDLMQHLAFHMHQQGEKQGREVSEAALRQIMAQEPLYADMVDDLIALTRVRGTLLEERMEIYRFLHLAFQEYLAARYLAEIVRGEGGVAAIAEFLEQGPLLDSWWREVALLTPGYLMVTSAPTAQLLLQRLASLDKEAAARKLTADVALAAVEVAATAFWEWGASRTELQELQREISQKLVGLLADGELAVQSKPMQRAAVGVALARLGDLRPEVMEVDGMQFCYVPPGPFWMGSDEARDNEKPQHWVEMPHPYWLGRFPVTNAQYALFVEEGGYAMERYWPEAKADGVWRDGKVQGLLENAPRDRQASFGHPFDLLNHPAGGVTWYEALAYTRWLMARWRECLPTGWVARLPTEAEWEKAAQGSGQVPAEPVVRHIVAIQVDMVPRLVLRNNGQPQSAYIWGDEADANRANCKASGIGTTSAVGCFPGGVSPYGTEEMAGNVWEWTNSKYKGYAYQVGDGREEVDASGDGRVLRGGSFYESQDVMRCVYRSRNLVHGDSRHGGFRVCVSPFLF